MSRSEDARQAVWTDLLTVNAIRNGRAYLMADVGVYLSPLLSSLGMPVFSTNPSAGKQVLFDLVVASSVDEAAGLVSPGGRLVVSTRNKEGELDGTLKRAGDLGFLLCQIRYHRRVPFAPRLIPARRACREVISVFRRPS